MKNTKIVIAGGGFAGLYAAEHFDKHLACRADVEVTLISRENFILFTPMLHEVAAGDLFFGREIEQALTPRDVEALTDGLARLRASKTRNTNRWKTGADGLVATMMMIGRRGVGRFFSFF